MANMQDSLTRLLDEALRTGAPVVVEHRGRRLRVTVEEAPLATPPEPPPQVVVADDPSLKPLPVDLSELASALDQGDEMAAFFLDTETGRLLIDYDDAWEDERPDFEEDDRYLYVDPWETSVSYGVMEDFVATVRDPRLRERLETAIQGRGAFRRFKDALPGGEWERWNAYREVRHQQMAVDWLATHGFRPEL